MAQMIMQQLNDLEAMLDALEYSVEELFEKREQVQAQEAVAADPVKVAQTDMFAGSQMAEQGGSPAVAQKLDNAIQKVEALLKAGGGR